MKHINEYILESGAVETMFHACMEVENNQTIYKNHLWPLVKTCCKKVDKFDCDKLENSSSIDKIITASLKAIKAKVDSENRKLLRKYMTSIVIKLMGSQINVPKELEDYMIEWDFYNGDHKLEW